MQLQRARNSARRDSAGLIDDLQRLGFTDYEARAYIALLHASPATAYEVSKAAGLPRANAYNVLESLTFKKAAQPVSKVPMRFVPVDPATLLPAIAAETAQRCDSLVQKLAVVKDAEDEDHVWTITGEKEVHAKIRQMIESSQRHIWIKTLDVFLDQHREAFEAAAARGVEILVILFGDRPERYAFGPKTRVYLHEGNGIPVGIAHHQITLTRDFEEALIVRMVETPYGASTRNRPVVTMADTMIRHEIYISEIFELLGEQIHEAFGPALIALRRKYLPAEQMAALEQRLNARKES